MTHPRKLLEIGFLSPVFRSSEDILAICFQLRDHHSLKFCAKEFTSSGFTFFKSCSEVGSFSFGLCPNSSHQLETAPEILSWFAEWIVLHKSSVFDESAWKCMVSLLFSFLRIPHNSKHWASWKLDDWYLWIVPLFEWPWKPIFPSGVLLRVPYRFISSPGPRNVQSPRENLFAYFLTFSEFETHCSEFPLFVHSMSLNIDMKMIRSSKSSGSMFRSCMSFCVFWRISNVASPGISLELNRFSINSKQISGRIGLSKLFYLIFPSSIRFWIIWHFLQAQLRNQSRRVLLLSSTWSLDHAWV